eukprot:SAG31_NODE_4453_length_3218_cov_3.694453_3_plen_85_part_01
MGNMCSSGGEGDLNAPVAADLGSGGKALGATPTATEVRIAESSTHAKSEDTVRAELSGMKLGALRKKARAVGIDSEAMDDIEEEE